MPPLFDMILGAYLRDDARGAVGAPGQPDDGVALLQRPRVHEHLDGVKIKYMAILVGGFCQVLPQIVLSCIAVLATE